jgi:hypothetical protein
MVTPGRRPEAGWINMELYGAKLSSALLTS